MTGTTENDLKASAFQDLRDRAISAGRDQGFVEGIAFVKAYAAPLQAAPLTEVGPTGFDPSMQQLSIEDVWDAAFEDGRKQGFADGIKTMLLCIDLLPSSREGLVELIEQLKSLHNTENPEMPFSTVVEDLDFTVRTYNCLKRDGVFTVGDLLKRSEATLSDIRNFGWKSVDEVIAKLAHYGYKLSPSPEGFVRE